MSDVLATKRKTDPMVSKCHQRPTLGTKSSTHEFQGHTDPTAPLRQAAPPSSWLEWPTSVWSCSAPTGQQHLGQVCPSSDGLDSVTAGTDQIQTPTLLPLVQLHCSEEQDGVSTTTIPWGPCWVLPMNKCARLEVSAQPGPHWTTPSPLLFSLFKHPPLQLSSFAS